MFAWNCQMAAALLARGLIAGLLPTLAAALPDKEALLNEPYVEWTLAYEGDDGNPYDVIAHALFTHEQSGATTRSLMFYDGEGRWRVRFTGTRLGRWTITTTGPGTLGGRLGTITVRENPEPRNGFFTTQGEHWIWSGTDRAVVPQFVMLPGPASFWREGDVDTDRIDAVVSEFIDQHGFTGFHLPGGAGWWFNMHEKDTKENGRPVGPQDPDRRTFRVLEELLVRSYRAGAAVHIWMWGADSHARSGPEGIGGPMSETDRRILRYIAARLGPIPGWSMGYGYDLHAWADDQELQTWYDFLKDQLGGWPHPLGARADRYDANNVQLLRSQKEKLTRRPVSSVFWIGDYVGHYDYRVAYAWYAEIFGHAGKPQFQEDRFRIRSHRIFQHKDYTPEMTLRALWHSTMAGGVANIWGNLLGSGNDGGSLPYDNHERGTIQEVDFTVDIKAQIKTYSRFWFAEKRFSSDLLIDNQLTDNKIGVEFLLDEIVPISVCLRDDGYQRYVFYSEQTRQIRVDLTGSDTPLLAVAVDTRLPYKEINVGPLDPNEHVWEAPHPSHWAIAIGDFDE